MFQFSMSMFANFLYPFLEVSAFQQHETILTNIKIITKQMIPIREYLRAGFCPLNSLFISSILFFGFFKKFLIFLKVKLIFSFRFISAIYSRLPFLKTTSKGCRFKELLHVSIFFWKFSFKSKNARISSSEQSSLKHSRFSF